MDSSIDINELAKKITKEISEHNDSKNDINDEDFQKLIELEKLNKKLKKSSEESNDKKQEQKISKKKNFSLINLKNILIESLILLILFVLINHEQFNKLIKFIPIGCINNNNIINLLFKGCILVITFRLLSIIVN